ncbi:glycosyltransferase family 4 protein [Paenibacillus silviterrae]|uniref:glycosyltransferase family 4 protein n=1 Tax=Paenibacillus silviterrae TaxID=3242194 RepID=UPI002542931A|nr:glycosyltransferase family 4 protein [Paenibacillus chinjuensis]
MRCLQIVESYSSAGGMERFVYNFTRLWEEQGGESLIAGFEIEGLQHWGNAKISSVVLPEQIEAWVEAANAYSPDLIVWHIQGPRSAAVIKRLSQSYPVSATIHGVMCPSGSRLCRDRDEICYQASGASCYSRWYLRKCGTSASPFAAYQAVKEHKQVMEALKRCERVYAVSQAIRGFLSIEGVSTDRITVFDNTLGGLKQLPALQLPAARGKLSLLYVGRLVYAKGVQYLLRAVRHLVDRGLEVECVIAGEGWYEPALRQLAEELKLPEQLVHFAGKVPGQVIDRYYAEADVVIVPSVWPDPSPLVVPEARKLGKPVIVFEAGGLPEWAEFMDGVLIAEHGRPDSLADTILKVYSKADINRSRTKQTQQRVDLISAMRSSVGVLT